MKRPLVIDNVQLATAPSEQQREGLLGWISCTLNDGLRLSGLALRRTESGKLTISFPARRDSFGRQHFFIRPLNDPTRREIERQVVEALSLEEGTRR